MVAGAAARFAGLPPGSRVAALAALPALVDGGPVRLLDDLSYGVGVWKGMIAEGNFAPLMPDLRSWPGRQRPEQPAVDSSTGSSA